MSADNSSRDDTPKFRSPTRSLALSFRLSRDRWKHKALQRRQQIKTLLVRVRDLEVSRDLWKEKALQAQLPQPLSSAASLPLTQIEPGVLRSILDQSPNAASAALDQPSLTTPARADATATWHPRVSQDHGSKKSHGSGGDTPSAVE